MKKTIYIYIISLGCAKNFVDTEVIAASLITSGLGITPIQEEADITLINTCAFIPPARKEAEDNIADALKWKSKKKEKRKIIVSGCLTQWDKKHIYPEKYPEIDLWLGIDEIPVIPEKINNLFSNKDEKHFICNFSPKFLYDEKTPRILLSPPHYANIKISEGCNNMCSYCSIPSIRGSLRSRNINSVYKEFDNLIRSGVKEIIIIAQDITAFAKDKNNLHENLAHLIQKLDKIKGDHWIRLQYLHPEGITDELIDTISKSEHVIPYLDIPLQHASDKILKSMNRRINLSQLNKILEKLKSNINNLVLRTTFILGFPGEENSDFNILRNFIEKWQFERVGVFPFYPEPNTKAYYMKNRVPENVALKRAEHIQKIHRKHSIKFNQDKIGKEFKVIIDNNTEHYALGRTYMDSPEVDNIVKIRNNNKIKEGHFYNVKIKNAENYALLGELMPSNS